MKKYILHLDMDAFFASVEQAANPRLRGKPLIVGGRQDKRRTVVCAASYEAKKMGVDSGMSCKEAFRICPQAEFVTADSAKYLYVSQQIFELLKNYSPQVEQASVDEFYLDITGIDKIFGSYLELAKQIKDSIRNILGITGSVGISINRIMSKIAAKLNKPDGLVIMEEKDIPIILADLAVEKIPGIGKKLTERLHGLSIYSFTDLAEYPSEFFLERFGKLGLWMHAVAHPEEDADQVHWYAQKRELQKSVGHSYTLPQDIYGRANIESWLRLLCEMVGSRLRQNNLESITLHVYLRNPDMSFIGKEKNFKAPTNDSYALYQRAVFILNSLYQNNKAVRALGVTARNLTLPTKGFLFNEQEKRANIQGAQDAINERYGDWTVYPASIFSINCH
ncbi:MAG: DNA polymerase IV [Candidatus Omnitrophota bacterium]